MLTSWNLYPTYPIHKNGRIEEKYLNLLRSGVAISLGICNFNMRFFQKLYQRIVSGAFFMVIL